MIRTLRTTDVGRVADLAINTNLFPEEARAFLESSAQDGVTPTDGVRWFVFDREGSVDGVAFVQAREATDRVWDITMLAVAPDAHGSGVGGHLLQHVESELRTSNQRMVVIETSSLPAYDRTRRFYAWKGYNEVARVPDYFCDGDDMVVFSKHLKPDVAGS